MLLKNRLNVCLAIMISVFSNVIAAEELPIPGRLVSTKDVIVTAEIAGAIESVNADISASISAGKTVIKLRCDVIKAQVNAAYAKIAVSKTTLKSKEQLAAAGALPKHELAIAKANLKATQAEAGVAAASRKLCSYKAPFAGRLVDVLVQPGDYVSAGDPLYRLSGGKLIAIADVANVFWGQIQQDDTIKIKVASSESVLATVTTVTPYIDQDTQRFHIRASLNDTESTWVPGLDVNFVIHHAEN